MLWLVFGSVVFLSVMHGASQVELHSQLVLQGSYNLSSRLFWQAEQSLRQVEGKLERLGVSEACSGQSDCHVSIKYQSGCLIQYRIQVCESQGSSKQCVVSIYALGRALPGCVMPVTAERVRWTRVFD